MFLQNQTLTLVSNLVVAPIFGAAIWFNGNRTDIFWWVALLYAVTLARVGLAMRIRGFGDVEAWPAWSARALVTGSLISGVLWGAGVVCVTDPADTIAVGISSFFIAGMISGATVALSTILPAFIGFAAPFVLPFALMVLLRGGDTGAAMAVSLFVYAGGMLVVTVKFNRQIRDMLVLRWTNESLLAEVVAERDRAEAASRVKSDFLARMSHELRTLLNAIIGFSDILKSGRYRDDGFEAYEDFAEEIYQGGQHLLDLVDDLLDIAKIESGKIELNEQPIRIAAAIDFALAIQTDQARAKNLELTADDVAKDLSLRVNERALRQMLINLLSNAVKFTPSGGAVRVSAALEQDGGILISVHDTGIGIPSDKLTEVLQPFRQLETPFTRYHSGTGLGLAIVASLAGHFGARFDLQSDLGAGTTATLHFPKERTAPD